MLFKRNILEVNIEYAVSGNGDVYINSQMGKLV